MGNKNKLYGKIPYYSISITIDHGIEEDGYNYTGDCSSFDLQRAFNYAISQLSDYDMTANLTAVILYVDYVKSKFADLVQMEIEL